MPVVRMYRIALVRPLDYIGWMVTITIALMVPAARAASPAASEGLQTIGTGEYQCFYLVNGKILAAGSNRAGELGVGNGPPYTPEPPREIAAPADVKFVDVSAGGYHSLAVDSTGHVWTWGSDLFGQKGDGGPLDKPGVPTPDANGIPSRIVDDNSGKEFHNVVHVTSGWWFDAALKNDGTVWVWGRDADETKGIVGNGDTARTAINSPSQVLFDPPASIVQVATAGNFLIALDSKGRVWSWGGGKDSTENRGSGNKEFSRPHLLPNLPAIKQIAAGDRFSYALDANGSLWGWGLCGTFMGLGPATGGWVPTPLPVKLAFPEFGRHSIASVAVSAHSSHVILDDGTLWGWGDSAMGEVGNGAVLDFSKHKYAWDWGNFECMIFRPVRIVPSVSNFKAVYSTAMCFYSYAVTRDRRVFSWGRNKTGILGDGVIPTGNTAERPDSWEVAAATEVYPLKPKEIRMVSSK